jgi:glycosyltransferase involved in cell wall biosynthesis
MDTKNVWVVIPAHNESKRVGSVIEKAKKYVKNVIVVDDGSKDDTEYVASRKGAIVLRHVINMQKGAAVKTGCDYALKKGAEKIVLVDADGQHNPNEIPKFLEALEEADIVFGYRRMNRNMPFVFRRGNWFLNRLVAGLFGIRLKDTQCGYRAFTANAYKKIRWRALDYSMESEMIANVGKNHLRYKEIPIETLYLDRYKGTTIIDGIKIALNLIKWRFGK